MLEKEEERKKFADKEDVNGDGHLDRSEISHWLFSHQTNDVDQEVLHLMERADADQVCPPGGRLLNYSPPGGSLLNYPFHLVAVCSTTLPACPLAVCLRLSVCHCSSLASIRLVSAGVQLRHNPPPSHTVITHPHKLLLAGFVSRVNNKHSVFFPKSRHTFGQCFTGEHDRCCV